jgi:cellulose synthase/poly-beta-1,6-N-acetylglucosamine synthase-like glycosyltransferase
LTVGFLIFTFWFSVAAVVLITLGYPVFLALAGPFARRPRRTDESEPWVTLIIPAYNEESTIAEKLDNCLDLDYPRDKLEVVVASDGSTDRTNAIVESYADRGIVLAAFPRTGKTGVQNRVALRARGAILIFSDANAFYNTDAVRKLVRNFADPQVAGVCGQLKYRVREAAGAGESSDSAGASERLYWSYEKFMKLRESELSSVVGANGSIYAVRRADYVQLDEGVISDLVEPLALVRSGKRVVYEPEAVSVEDASMNYNMEFRRKVRILTRSIFGLLSMRGLLNPLRFGIFSVQFLMHKLLRFVTPLFLILGAGALAGLAIANHSIYRWLFGAALVGVASALVAGRKMGGGKVNWVLRGLQLLYYYLLVNYALVLAWCNVLRGNRMQLWSPERKVA